MRSRSTSGACSSGESVDKSTTASRRDTRFHWSHLHKYIFPQFGSLPLEAITPTGFKDWRLTLPLANATRNHIRNTFKILMDPALKDRHVMFNPILLTKPEDKKQ